MITDLDNLHLNADGENKKNVNPEETPDTNDTGQNPDDKTDTIGEQPENESQEASEAADTEAEKTSEEQSAQPDDTTEESANESAIEAEMPSVPESEFQSEVNTEEEIQEMTETQPEAEAKEATSQESGVQPEVSSETETSREADNQLETSAEEATQETKENSGEDSESYKTEESETEENEEDEETSAEEEIPKKNYEELPLSVLIGEAKNLLKNHPAQKLKSHFREIREVVKKIVDEDEAAKKEAFIEEEGGDELDFQYHNPHVKEFNQVYGDFRNQLDAYHKEQEKAQEENLKERLQIIEELKALYTDSSENNSNIFSKFRNIKSRWHNAGIIPRAQARNVFRTYFHHLDNFYKYLDLNKELREMDYAHNLEVRHSIISRAEELVKEDNVQKALNELQYLHRLWKEEAVPVAEDLREPTWQKFKALTLQIHDRKTELNEQVKAEQEENLKKKQEVLDKITALTENAVNMSHRDWQTGIRKLNHLRDEFIAIGRVPREFNQKLWNDFKTQTRTFNHKKNEFYKSLKKEQTENLEKKKELLEIAKQHAESQDWERSVQEVKRIQAEWKKIGHVPRKFSDEIWKEFKAACNQFFENFKSRGDKDNLAFMENFEKKKALLDELQAFEKSDDTKADLDKVNNLNIQWNNIGKVPMSKIKINNDFNKLITRTIKSLGLSENEIQDFKMASLVDQIKSDHDEQKLDDEIRRSRKLIEDLEKDINQLETNIGFFKDENSPLLKNFHMEIAEKRNRLAETEMRLKKLHRIDLDEEIQPEPPAETADDEENPVE